MSTIKKIRNRLLRILPSDAITFIRKIKRLGMEHHGNPEIPKEELRIFTLLKDRLSVVFDVGAREDLVFYTIHPDCSYHLFEPNIRAIASLKKQMALFPKHDIILNEFGLSDKDEDNCVYYEESQSFVVNPNHKGKDTGIRYSLRRLDEYVSSNNIEKIDFLKIDAEGFDYKIILGGIETVRTKVSFLQFEYWDGVKKFKEILDTTFDLYLIMEQGLLETIRDEERLLTADQKQKNYRTSLIPLDDGVVDLIDRVFVPIGWNGNILCIKKGTAGTERLIFDIA